MQGVGGCGREIFVLATCPLQFAKTGSAATQSQREKSNTADEQRGGTTPRGDIPSDRTRAYTHPNSAQANAAGSGVCACVARELKRGESLGVTSLSRWPIASRRRATADARLNRSYAACDAGDASLLMGSKN
jgi:hypothetical protein